MLEGWSSTPLYCAVLRYTIIRGYEREGHYRQGRELIIVIQRGLSRFGKIQAHIWMKYNRAKLCFRCEEGIELTKLFPWIVNNLIFINMDDL